MSKPKFLDVPESFLELRKLQKNVSQTLNTRVEALILIKRLGGEISKRALAKRLGVNHNSVQRWRDAYERGGIEALLKDGRIGFKPSVFTAKEHEIIRQKVFTSEVKTYVELLKWVEDTFNKKIKYNTLLKYCIKHFGTLSQVSERERKTSKKRKKNNESQFEENASSSLPENTDCKDS